MKNSNPDTLLALLKEIAKIDQLQLGENYLKTITAKMGKALDVEYVLLGRSKSNDDFHIMTDVAWSKSQGFMPNFEYALAGTPCQYVITGNRVCVHTKDVARIYPDDPLLEEMKIEGYVGAPIIDRDHNLSGLIVALETKPIDPVSEQEIIAILEFFSSRIALEYFRIEAEAKILAHNEKLEKEIRERTLKLIEVETDLRNQEKLANLGMITMGVAHEIKNPLNLIYSSSEIIKIGIDKFIQKNDFNNHEALMTFLKKIKSASEVISKQTLLANDSLESLLKKARSGELRASNEDFDLRQTIEEASKNVWKKYAEENLQNEVHFVSHAPEISVSLPHADALTKALEIFLDNALYNLRQKMKNAPSFRPELSIEASVENNICKIIIRDNGTGIPEKELTLLGQPFISSKPKGEGSGLGIYLAKIFVERNDGLLQFHSVSGEYTEVEITLNLAPAQ